MNNERNATWIPGFTAESALDTNRGSYRSDSAVTPVGRGAVLMQYAPGEKCFDCKEDEERQQSICRPMPCPVGISRVGQWY
jgi:hypothetical protein